jgi:hypothetical protein
MRAELQVGVRQALVRDHSTVLGLTLKVQIRHLTEL